MHHVRRLEAYCQNAARLYGGAGATVGWLSGGGPLVVGGKKDGR